MIVAAFDFDGTLTHRDTVVPFLRRAGGTAPLAVRLLVRPHRTGPSLARRDRDRLKEIVSAHAFARRRVADVEVVAEAYARELVERRLRADTVDRLRWHAGEGHRVVIVSAGYDLYLDHVGAALGVDGVVATRLERDGAFLTGRLDGANCRGPEKVRRLDAWLRGNGWDRDGVTLFAYGDSTGDRELLAWADHPHRVAEPLGSVAPSD